MSFLYICDLIGTFAFAISGAVVGVNKKMDLYGMFILALVTGVGGGTVRDMILGRHPPFVLKDVWYLVVIIGATLLVFFLYKNVRRSWAIINIVDAAGLGVFTCIGATIADSSGCSWYGIVLIGVMTATVGGMIRDVLAQEIPFVLKREIYASASIAGAFLFLLLQYLTVNTDINIVITSVFITFIRIITFYRHTKLPTLFRKRRV